MAGMAGKRMAARDSVSCPDRASWRTWLAAHHDRRTEVWLLFFKKGTGRPTVNYDEAVEEAISFGWIDSVIRRVDDAIYAQKFTPRTNEARWSAKNIERAHKMIREGLMTEAGMTKFRPSAPHVAPAARPDLELAPELRAVLEARPKAFGCFGRLSPSQKRLYIGWIMSAKKEETRKRRLAEAVERLEKGLPLGLK